MKVSIIFNKKQVYKSITNGFIYLFLLILITIQTISCTTSNNEIQKIDVSELRITFAVTDFSVGENRIAFAILDPNKGVIIPESMDVSTYHLDAKNPDNKIETLETTFRQWPNGKGVYTVNANFNKSGKWGIGINLFHNKKFHGISTFIIVPENSQTPPIGSKAPTVETKTISSVEEISEITSAINPHLPLYEMSLKNSIESKTPTIILFATPAFCQTGTCGPQLDIMKSLSLRWHGQLNFIHSEIYSNPNDINGDISNAKISKAAVKWNLPSEPWTFVIDESGKIISKFEGFVTAEELEESIGFILNTK
jgi:hypothetical protein